MHLSLHKLRLSREIHEKIHRLKIILYLILIFSAGIGLYYLYNLNIEIGLFNILAHVDSLGFTYLATIILLLGVIVPVLIGIYIIAFYISQIRLSINIIPSLKEEMIVIRNEIETLREILDNINNDIIIMQQEKKEEETNVEEIGEEETITDANDEEEDKELEEIEGRNKRDTGEIKEENDLEILEDLLSGLREVGKELEKLRKKLL